MRYPVVWGFGLGRLNGLMGQSISLNQPLSLHLISLTWDCIKNTGCIIPETPCLAVRPTIYAKRKIGGNNQV